MSSVSRFKLLIRLILGFILSKPNKRALSASDLAYADDLNAAMLAKTPIHSRLLIYIIGALVVSGLTWAYFAELDEVTVGTGKVIPSQQIQIIQNLEGGIVKEILVREGQVVRLGQELLAIDETRFLSDYREQAAQGISLAASIIRLKTELDSVHVEDEKGVHVVKIKQQSLDFSELDDSSNQQILQRQKELYKERLRNLANQVAILDQQVNQKKSDLKELQSKIHFFEEAYHLAEKELSLTKPLARKGVVSEVELIKLQRQANEVKGQLESARISIPKLRSEINEVGNKREEVVLKFRSEGQQNLAEQNSKLVSLDETLVSLKDRLKRTVVKSPVRGTIKTIKINTVGGVVQPGMDLVEIVPIEDSLLIEAKILPKDIAFLRPKLDAVIKLTAYDFAIYGGLKGTVEHISADTILDEKDNSYYLIRVRTEDNYVDEQNNPLPIIPGMTASVDVITGKKNVLEYILKPIIRAKQNALREK